MAIAKKITTNDVAQVAGISVSTASLILSDKGRISSATSERVNQTIEQLGLVRNHQAVSPRGGQSEVISLIVSNLSKPSYAESIAGLTDALERQGEMVFLIQGGRSGEKTDQWFDTLAAQRVDGVIIAGSIDRKSELRGRAVQAGVPLVFVSRASYLGDVDLIRPDNMQAARLVTEHLVRRGHQWIAWLDGQSPLLTRAERVDGYCAALLKYGLPFRSEWALRCESSQEQVVKAMTGPLHQNLAITVVLCYNSVVTTSAWFGLLRAGRQSGEDDVEGYFEQQVVLAAFAGMPEAALDDLSLAWVTTPAHEMGKILAESMPRRLGGGTGEARNQIMPPRLVTQK